MNEPTPTNPAPSPVPWTPEMANQQHSLPAPVPAAQPSQMARPIPTPYPPTGPVSQQPAIQSGAPVHTGVAQAYSPQPHFPQPAQSNQPQPIPPLPVSPMSSQPPMPNQAHQSAAHQQQAQPYHSATQPPMYQQQQAHPSQYAAPHQNAVPHQAPYPGQMAASPIGQMEAPTLAGIGHVGMGQDMSEAQPSKSLFAKLLKRSPKPASQDASNPLPPNSSSLLGKKFGLGAAFGFAAAFGLMTVLNMFAAEPAQQAQRLGTPSAAIAGVSTAQAPARTRAEGNTFIDNAIAADAP